MKTKTSFIIKIKDFFIMNNDEKLKKNETQSLDLNKFRDATFNHKKIINGLIDNFDLLTKKFLESLETIETLEKNKNEIEVLHEQVNVFLKELEDLQKSENDRITHQNIKYNGQRKKQQQETIDLKSNPQKRIIGLIQKHFDSNSKTYESSISDEVSKILLIINEIIKLIPQEINCTEKLNNLINNVKEMIEIFLI